MREGVAQMENSSIGRLKSTILVMTILVLVFCITLVAYGSDVSSVTSIIDKNRLETSIKTLSSFGSRVLGYPGHDRAADYVYETFQMMGLKDIEVQEFTSVVPLDKGATLEILTTGEKIELLSLWPNHVRTTTTSPEGLTGNLLYAGEAKLIDFDYKDVEDSIVIVDFESDNWLNVGLLGGKAVIFIEPDDAMRVEAESKFIDTPINLPRFWISKADAEPLLNKLNSGEEIQINVKARMDWEEVIGKNILGFIEGTDPDLKNETVIITASYDSMSVVPMLSPGAEQAVGISSLFEIARALTINPPKRTVLFLATGGHSMAFEGIRKFVYPYTVIEEYRNDDGTPNQKKIDGIKDADKRAEIQNFFERDRLGQSLKSTIAVSLDLSSQNRQVGLFYTGRFWNLTGDVPNPTMVYSGFGRLIEKQANNVGEVLDLATDEYFVDTINRPQGRTWTTFMGSAVGFDAETFTIAGGTGMGFVTTNDLRGKIDTPFDTADRINIQNVYNQTRMIAGILTQFLDTPLKGKEEPGETPMPDYVKLGDTFHHVKGETTMVDARHNFMPISPVPDMLVTIGKYSGVRSISGVRTRFYTYSRVTTVTTKFGEPEDKSLFFFPGITSEKSATRETPVRAYKFDPQTGDIVTLSDLGQNGGAKYSYTLDRWPLEQEITMVVFHGVPIDMYDLIDQRYFTPLSSITILDARTDASPLEYSYERGGSDPVAIVYAAPMTPIKVTMTQGLIGLRFAALNSNEENPVGDGFMVGEVSTIKYAPYQAAQDIWLIDEMRITTMEEKGIENHRVRQLHDLSAEKLTEAQRFLENKQYSKFLESAREAWAFETRAYPEVTATTDDSVKGVMFYLAMLLPFSFFAERLFFAFPDIRKQIPAILGIFGAIFLVMRYIHPAFELALAPAVLLLAFIILALTFTVIWIVGGKFEEEIAKLRPKRAGVEHVDVGRAAASSVAFMLGIENMRKRKTRTILTCITLIILTFTVMSFTSLKAYLRHNKITLGEDPPYEGILLRDKSWANMSKMVYSIMDNKYTPQGNLISPRRWYMTLTESAARMGEKSYIDVRSGENHSIIDAVVGFTPWETEIVPIDETLIAGSWFEEDDEFTAIIPQELAEKLNISESDLGKAQLTLSGITFTVRGIFDSKKFQELRDLDDEELTPVDYSSMVDMMDMGGSGDMMMSGDVTMGAEDMPQRYVHLTADNIMIVPSHTASFLGGGLRSVAIKTGPNSSIEEMVEELITRVALYIYVGMDGNKYVYSTTGMTSIEGMQNVAIPLLIAGLIVLNTMLGSVFERTREIEIYSAVGLAPLHIGALFMAESVVYAVLGAIAGYVTGQVVAKFIMYTGLLPDLGLNYSSMAAVGSTGIVMLVVIISTIYPAKQASQLAAPSIERRWKLPAPDGDNLFLILPFTLSPGEGMGAGIFLKEFVEGHDEQSVGNFQARNVKFYAEPTDDGRQTCVIEFVAHLAPFDLGVMQQAKLMIKPAEGKKEYQVELDINREAGDIPNWRRANQLFVTDIRKQFLIWRTVIPAEKDNYERRSLEALELLERS